MIGSYRYVARMFIECRHNTSEFLQFSLLRMFETTPEVREAFEKFRTLDECQELSQSSVMEIHGMAVMNAIDEIISNLDDESILVDIILNQGKAHARFGDLTETMFWVG